MALLPIIRKGDRTTHGGTVLEGFPNDTIHGIEIAGLGHLVTCPMCKGVFPIMECLPDFTIDGVGVAVQGMRTACGAALLASQDTDLAEYTSGYGANLVAANRTSSNDDETYDQHFCLTDEITGMPLAKRFYRMECNGRIVEGYSDENGFTAKVEADDPTEVKIEIFPEGYVEQPK